MSERKRTTFTVKGADTVALGCDADCETFRLSLAKCGARSVEVDMTPAQFSMLVRTCARYQRERDRAAAAALGRRNGGRHV